MSELEAPQLPNGIILPKGHLSISQIETYLRCGLQYWFRYIEGIISPPSIQLITGSSGHAALELNFTYKAETEMDAPIGDVLDAFSDAFEEKYEEIDRPNPVTKGNAKDKTADLIKLHQKEVAPSLQPILGVDAAGKPLGVEKKLEMVIGGIPMLGFADLETNTAIIDHKFVGRAKSVADADESLQLTFYAQATGKPDVAFNCLVKPKLNRGGSWSQPAVKMIPGKSRGEKDYNWLASVVRFVASAISAGVFLPAEPGSWMCGPKYCGYWDRCRGAGKDIAPKVIAMNAGKRTHTPKPEPRRIVKDAPVFQLEV